MADKTTDTASAETLREEVERLRASWQGRELGLTVTEFWIVYAMVFAYR